MVMASHFTRSIAALLFCILTQFLPHLVQAARDPASALVDPLKMFVYDAVARGGRLLKIPMDFADANADAADVRAKLRNALIARVDLVYTDYPKGRDLTALNQRRFDKLREIAPELFANTAIEWRVIAQTSPRTEADARALFHGIVITYRAAMTTAEHKGEIARISDLFKNENKSSTSAKPTASSPMMEERLSSLYDQLSPKGTTETAPAAPSDKAQYDSAPQPDIAATSMWNANGKTVSSGAAVDGRTVTEPITRTNWWGQDSTVFKVLSRKQWKKATIVCDLTSSMYPYTAQIVLWCKLTTMKDAQRNWVFFNDGDMKPESTKKIGSIGGIYAARTNDYVEVQKLAVKTMRAGYGGMDMPENNIEALIAAQKKDATADLVMVADNWAPIKDIALMDQVKRPVHVILCGVSGLINLDYLRLAYATSGSIHTMEEDLDRLAELREGATFELGGYRFIIKNGQVEFDTTRES